MRLNKKKHPLAGAGDAKPVLEDWRGEENMAKRYGTDAGGCSLQAIYGCALVLLQEQREVD
jgi:hypothetical protein